MRWVAFRDVKACIPRGSAFQLIVEIRNDLSPTDAWPDEREKNERLEKNEPGVSERKKQSDRDRHNKRRTNHGMYEVICHVFSSIGVVSNFVPLFRLISSSTFPAYSIGAKTRTSTMGSNILKRCPCCGQSIKSSITTSIGKVDDRW